MPRKVIDQNTNIEDNINIEDLEDNANRFEEGEEEELLNGLDSVEEPKQKVTEMKPVENGLEAYLRSRDIDHAMDAEGNIYHGTEEILKHLEDYESRLILMNKDETENIAIEVHLSYYNVRELAREDNESFQVSRDRTPEKNMLLRWNEKDIFFAKDAEGNRYETPEDIRKALSEENKMIFLYTNDSIEYNQVLVKDAEKEEDREYRQELNRNPEHSYAVILRDGKYFVSKSEVRDEDQAKVNADEFNEDEFDEIPDALEERRILDWKETDIAYAEDAEGNKYEGPEAVRFALSGIKVPKDIYDSLDETVKKNLPKNDVKLTVHFTDEREPVAVKRERDRFAIEVKSKGYEATSLKDLQDDDFEELNNVGVEFRERFQPENVAFAVDRDGKRYNSYKEIGEKLKRGNDRERLFIFEKKDNGLEVFAAEKRNGRLFVSDQKVTPETRLEDSDEYKPLKSLNTDPLIRFDLLKEEHDLGEEIKDKVGFRLKVIDTELEKAAKYQNEGAPKPPKKPVKPKLGFIDSVLWGLKKFFTFGLGDTDANRKLKQDLRKYNEELIPEYNKKMNQYRNMEGFYTKVQNEEYLKKLKNEQKKLKKKKDDISQKKNKLFDKIYMDGYDRQVENYQSRIEVKLAGVQDLEKKGRVTVDNLFAYTWLKRAELEDKDLRDPAVQEGLLEFIAASVTEERIVKDRASYTTHSKALDQRNVEELNNGNAVRYLKNDEVLKKCIDDAIASNEPLAPYSFYHDYLAKLGNVEQRQKDSAERMKKILVQMVKNFGEQEVTMEALDEVIRFERAMKAIKRTEMYNNADKLEKGQLKDSDVKTLYDYAKSDTTFMFNRVTDKERATYLPAFEALKGKGPMKLDDMHRQIMHKTKELENKKLQENAKNQKVNAL